MPIDPNRPYDIKATFRELWSMMRADLRDYALSPSIGAPDLSPPIGARDVPCIRALIALAGQTIDGRSPLEPGEAVRILADADDDALAAAIEHMSWQCADDTLAKAVGALARSAKGAAQ